MKLHFLSPLYAHPGPIASVCLDTSRDLDDPERAIDLRWRKLHKSLLAHDADEPTIRAIDEAVGTDREVSGRHGQAIFAAHGQLLLAECLPEPPARDSARYGMLPDALPLALQRAPDIPYAVVVIHRVHLAGPAGDEEVLELDHQSGRWPMSRVAPGEVAHRRIPVEGWPTEVEQLVTELVDRTDAEGLELIVLAGDPWAVNSLTRSAPRKLHGHFVKLKDGHHRRPEPGRALLEEELGGLLGDRLSDHDKHQLDAYLGQRARHPEYVEGIAATVAALQRGQAHSLILNQPVELDQHLWVGMAPTHLALSGEDLNAFGLSYYWEEPAVGAALIRAAAGTQADLIVVPHDELPLTDGAAVLLRYTGT
ncbi:hypothetical protein MTF65_01135 [Streptomyces sp. APSN-46.1]|uniref:baeRF2 domain-containing protein n=1 Tax=Streptomyces sp. APSN-46.1 TaxID=2929049 RepID=UPI001FB4948B|nr:hypothetical protein [Streptomyces sp. APSN-46.1]MCJ1675987.1 hypothetical protein [Streptomyces sp. APSN-46.1]